jgi:predicted  nucleic acid-binding Zn-ribbon protein
MKNEQDAQELKAMEEELKAKDTTLEKELTKSIEEKKSKTSVEEKLPKVKPKIKIKKIRMKKFGIETVRIPKEGVYEINLEALMKKMPLIILERERVYFIHLPSAFEKVKERS